MRCIQPSYRTPNLIKITDKRIRTHKPIFKQECLSEDDFFENEGTINKIDMEIIYPIPSI